MRTLLKEFDDALAGRIARHRKTGRILRVNLFGSYARGGWIEEPVGG